MTIGEILKEKDSKTYENIFETYIRVLCPNCENKDNEYDLCEIRRTIDGQAKCVNYKRCMENKCNTCADNIKCFSKDNITAKRNKPIMRSL